VLKELEISQEQLIILGILVGTDYNIGGIKGIGPKKALGLIKKYKQDYDSLFKEAKWDEFFDFSWRDVFELIKNMKVTDNYKLRWESIDKEKLIHIMVDEHDFSKERVENALAKLEESADKKQKGLGEFF
jgi:flap endonuclease-1